MISDEFLFGAPLPVQRSTTRNGDENNVITVVGLQSTDELFSE
jgi:hypothetical protein